MQVWCLFAVTQVVLHLLLQCVYCRNLLLSTFSSSFRCSEVWARFLVPDEVVDSDKLSQPVTYLLTSAWLVTEGHISCRPAWRIMWYPIFFVCLMSSVSVLHYRDDWRRWHGLALHNIPTSTYSPRSLLVDYFFINSWSILPIQLDFLTHQILYQYLESYTKLARNASTIREICCK